MYRLSELPEWHFNNCRRHGTLWSMNIGRHSQRLGNTLMNSYHTRPGTKLFILKTETSVQGAKGPESYNNRIRRCPNEDVFVTQPLESQVISNHLVLVPVSELSIESCLRSLACMEEKGLLFICRQPWSRLSTSPETHSFIRSSLLPPWPYWLAQNESQNCLLAAKPFAKRSDEAPHTALLSPAFYR